LGITGLDPLKYDLLFERFLNPERVSMPDIDIDFCYEKRGQAIEYVTRKYGQARVSQIITFGTEAAPENAFDEVDAYTSFKKQVALLTNILIFDEEYRDIWLNIRLPRVLLAVLV
ncbi:DNA polymerase III, alpha subunit, partial [human gut metagenome]